MPGTAHFCGNHRVSLRQASSDYVTNLNNLIKGTAFEGKSLERLFAALKVAYSTTQLRSGTNFLLELPGTERGWRTDWKSREAIAASFGSFADFKAQFTDAQSKTLVLAGPGW